MFYEVIYILIYLSIIFGSYFFLKKSVIKEVGKEQFVGYVLFVTLVASVMMPGVILAILQMVLYFIIALMGLV